MHRRLRKVFTSLKEHTTVSYAKIATAGGFCNVELIIVKATAPEDMPVSEKHIQELLKIFSVSPSSFHAFALSFSRRFSKTHCWLVAVKCLLLLHRLLRSLPQNSLFRSGLIWFRSNGMLNLYPCNFIDEFSSSASRSCSDFVNSYARLLDEALDCFALDPDNEKPESFTDKMKEVNRLVKVLPQIQGLIDRAIDCCPIGSPSRSFVIRSAMKYIIRDSFHCYTTFKRDIVLVLENLFQMPFSSSISAFDIYKKAALQAVELSEFYDVCKGMGFCGYYEYPFVDKIPQIQIQALESFLNGMWQLTETSSSPTSQASSLMDGSWSSVSEEDDADHNSQLMVWKRDVVTSTKWETFEETIYARKFERDDEEAPLIQLEEPETDSWEDLLEASISRSQDFPRSNFISLSSAFSSRHENGDAYEEEWKIQVYNPNALNPFYQPHNVVNFGGSSVTNILHPPNCNRISLKCLEAT